MRNEFRLLKAISKLVSSILESGQSRQVSLEMGLVLLLRNGRVSVMVVTILPATSTFLTLCALFKSKISLSFSELVLMCSKLIGARYYEKSVRGGGSARDTQGHGTHTASTAAGNMVKDARFFGVAKGNARGAVPSARIATYRVCTPDGCPNDAILAAFDDAIADGVDIVSISLRSDDPVPFDQDPTAIGSFHALKKGILTSNSAGNNGPGPQTITSNAPWLLTVAASSTDRRVINNIVLGNGKKVQVSLLHCT